MSDGLKHITLHLARCKEFPEGSTTRGYSFRAPLTPDGLLDADAWKSVREKCAVRRFWDGEPDQHGLLVLRAGGAGGSSWVFDYNPDMPSDDEPGYRLGTHRFAPGEYVSVRDDEGDMNTFVVAGVA